MPQFYNSVNQIGILESDMNQFKPKEVVQLLDQYIIGQHKAKKLVAIALRNRMRRKHIPEELQDEVLPKNILMIGPTGVGKTEIARRIAQLIDAPFIKVEATKFTERGYVGRDVEYMIRALVNHSVNLIKSRMREQARDSSIREVNRIIQKSVWNELLAKGHISESDLSPAEKRNLKKNINKDIKNGKYDDLIIPVKLRKKPLPIFPMVDMFPGMDDMEANIQSLFGGEVELETEERKKLSVREAKDALLAQKVEELIDKDKAIQLGLKWAQEMGIIFIDEIDKIADRQSGSGPDVSREGVQRDLLPIVEGTSVNTKYGLVKTDHILFIAAGAFNVAKPSDMIPELQGRFPIRIEMESLDCQDLRRILIEPKNSLVKQYIALLSTEGVNLSFTPDAFDAIASIAYEINNTVENIGARRLHTIMEFLMEDISFNAPDMENKKIEIDKKYVEERLSEIIKNTDVTQYIL